MSKKDKQEVVKDQGEFTEEELAAAGLSSKDDVESATAPDTDADAGPDTDTAPVPQPPKAPERVKIIIPPLPGPGGKDDVFMSVAGREYLIKRGKAVSVPRAVVNALNCCVRREYEVDADGVVVGHNDVQDIPFSVVLD